MGARGRELYREILQGSKNSHQLFPGVEEILKSSAKNKEKKNPQTKTHGVNNKNLEFQYLRVNFLVKNWVQVVDPVKATKSMCSWMSLENGERKNCGKNS